MPGARCARSLVCKIKKHTSIVTTVTPESPGIPRAMVLTVSFVLSPVTMLGCHRRLRFTRQLDTSVGASGPHDFAVRLKRRSSLSASASTASRPALMTLRNAPLWDRTVSDILLIWVCGEAKYFCKRGWTGFSDLPRQAKSARGTFEPRCHCVPRLTGARDHRIPSLVSGYRKLKESTPRLAPGCPQPPTMGLDDRAADREAHAHAVGLRRVEGFKETRQALRAQPVADIPHRDAHALRLDTYGADIGHGLRPESLPRLF